MIKDEYIVELQDGVWLTGLQGEHCRTFDRDKAKRYSSDRGARIALGLARGYMPFSDAWIYRLVGPKLQPMDFKTLELEGR